MKQALLLLAVVVFLFACKKEEENSTSYIHVVNFPIERNPNACIQTRDRNFLACCYINNTIYVTKFTKDGSVLLAKQFKVYANTYTQVSAIAEDANNNIYVCGSRENNFMLFKINSNGDSLWIKTYGGGYTKDAYSVIASSDGNIVMGGTTATSTVSNPYLVKVTPNGSLLWQNEYDENNSQGAYHILESSSGGYIITSLSDSMGTAYADYVYYLKISANGSKLWSKQNYFTSLRFASNTIELSDGSLLSCGQKKINEDWQVFILKSNPNGNPVWSSSFGDIAINETAIDLKEDSQGNIALVAETDDYQTGKWEGILYTVGPNGDSLSSTTFGTEFSLTPLNIYKDSGNGYIISGIFYGGPGPFPNIFTTRTDANGNFIP